MKRYIAAGLLALLAAGTFVSAADAKPHRHRHGGTTVIETAPSGIDVNTLLLLGTLGGGGLGAGGASALLPLLLAQPQATTVIERRGRRGH